jgi:hypothetical protein
MYLCNENFNSIQMRGPGKGNSGNPAGKPPGTKNKVGADVKKAIAQILENKGDEFNLALGRLEDKDFVRAYIDLLPYNIPKMATANLTIESIEEAKKTVHDLFPESIDNGQSESTDAE